MPIESQKYLIQNMERLTLFDIADGSCLAVVEDLQEGTMTNEQEDVYATGKNGVRIGSSSRNKMSRISVTSGTISDGVIGVQTGSAPEVKTVVVTHMEVLPVADGGATLTYKAQGATGKEVPFIYARNSDGTLGKKYAIGTEASADAFSFDPATGKITVPTDIKDGDQVIVFYDISVNTAKRIANYADKFSMQVKAVADVWAQGTCDGKSYYGKIIYGRSKASGNFELSFGNEFSVQSLEVEALSSTCFGDSNLLWDFVIFDGEDIEKVK